MENLVKVVNTLDDTFSSVNIKLIDLPRVVVIGCQSDGKSTVLEYLIKLDILPRGTGTVTRVPLVLQLHNTANTADKNRRHAFIFDDGNNAADEKKVITDPAEVRQEIVTRTIQLAGKGKNIVDKPILLKVFSPNVVNITMVDLPGVVKNPDQEQPADIEKTTTDMIKKYIEDPKTLIVAVAPANVDFAATESVKMAREVDPYHERTLVVLTKLDLMDEGTEASQILTDKRFPLGVVGIVGRSQKDINENVTIEQALVKEQKFLKDKYPTLCDRNGTQFLEKRLCDLVQHHLIRHLPQVANEVNQAMSHWQKRAENLGKELTMQQKIEILPKVLYKVAQAYDKAFDGRMAEIHMEKRGGASITAVFRGPFQQSVDAVNALDDITDENIDIAIQNANGLSADIFIPTPALEQLVKHRIPSLVEPSRNCVDMVLQVMQTMLVECCNKDAAEIKHFPGLHKEVLDTIYGLLEEKAEIAREKVLDIINNERSYINSRHPSFQVQLAYIEEQNARGRLAEFAAPVQPAVAPSGSAAGSVAGSVTGSVAGSVAGTGSAASVAGTPTATKPIPPKVGSSMDQSYNYYCPDVDLVKRLLVEYFKIVKINVADAVPKAIVNFLVQSTRESLCQTLVSKLNRQEKIELLKEAQDRETARSETDQMLRALHKASGILRAAQADQLLTIDDQDDRGVGYEDENVPFNGYPYKNGFQSDSESGIDDLKSQNGSRATPVNLKPSPLVKPVVSAPILTAIKPKPPTEPTLEF